MPTWIGAAWGVLKKLLSLARDGIIFFAGVKFQEGRQKKKVQEDKDDARKFLDAAEDKATDDIIDRLADDDTPDSVQHDDQKQV